MDGKGKVSIMCEINAKFLQLCPISDIILRRSRKTKGEQRKRKKKADNLGGKCNRTNLFKDVLIRKCMLKSCFDVTKLIC